MKRALVSTLLLLALTGCSAAPLAPSGSTAPAPGGPGWQTNNPTTRAVAEARSALDYYRGLQEDLSHAQTAQQRSAIQTNMEQATRNSLQTILSDVANTTTSSPPVQVTIYQTARDALGSGNNSGDIQTRINYNLDALRKIAGQQVPLGA